MTSSLAVENLNGLHGEEERLRVLSLAATAADPALNEHLELVGEAMGVVQKRALLGNNGERITSN